MPHPYPFHTYPMPKFEKRRTWHQRPIDPPICRMGFIVALLWSLCILIASRV